MAFLNFIKSKRYETLKWSRCLHLPQCISKYNLAGHNSNIFLDMLWTNLETMPGLTPNKINKLQCVHRNHLSELSAAMFLPSLMSQRKHTVVPLPIEMSRVRFGMTASVTDLRGYGLFSENGLIYPLDSSWTPNDFFLNSSSLGLTHFFCVWGFL